VVDAIVYKQLAQTISDMGQNLMAGISPKWPRMVGRSSCDRRRNRSDLLKQRAHLGEHAKHACGEIAGQRVQREIDWREQLCRFVMEGVC
jgi:hypothetical protein